MHISVCQKTGKPVQYQLGWGISGNENYSVESFKSWDCEVMQKHERSKLNWKLNSTPKRQEVTQLCVKCCFVSLQRPPLGYTLAVLCAEWRDKRHQFPIHAFVELMDGLFWPRADAPSFASLWDAASKLLNKQFQAWEISCPLSLCLFAQ